MKNIIYTVAIIALFISCKQDKVKSKQMHQEETPVEQIVIDTTDGGNFGEHQSIHQREWEKHQNTTQIDSNKF